MLAAVDVQKSMSIFKSDITLIFWPSRVGAGGFVPPGVPSPVSRFFPTAPGLKFGRQRIWAAPQKLFTFSSMELELDAG